MIGGVLGILRGRLAWMNGWEDLITREAQLDLPMALASSCPGLVAASGVARCRVRVTSSTARRLR